MAGGDQQHSAKGIPVRLIGIIRLLVVFRPSGVRLLPRLGDRCQYLLLPAFYRRLYFSGGHFIILRDFTVIWGNTLKGISVFLRPSLNGSFPVVRIVPSHGTRVNIKPHYNAPPLFIVIPSRNLQTVQHAALRASLILIPPPFTKKLDQEPPFSAKRFREPISH